LCLSAILRKIPASYLIIFQQAEDGGGRGIGVGAGIGAGSGLRIGLRIRVGLRVRIGLGILYGSIHAIHTMSLVL